MKIWYISRTYSPEKTGGALIRIAQVDYFRSQGAQVVVVAPDYDSRLGAVSEDAIRLPYCKSRIRLDQMLERVGWYEDYLDRWVEHCQALLKGRVQPDDCIFATSGGELACIKLGSRLKALTGCKLVVNLHDPIDYTLVHGRMINTIPHTSRESEERHYLGNADLVVCSSQSNQASLSAKYPELTTRIRCAYFGFMTPGEIRPPVASDRLTVVYGGTYDKNQSPELLAAAVQGLDNVQAHFVGNHAGYKPLQWARVNQPNCSFINQLSYPDFLRYLSNHADLGFVSLASPYLGACLPSKMFEYINIALPIFGALPAGDARDLINAQGYGVACAYDDVPSQRAALQQLAAQRQSLVGFRQRLLQDRDSWHMPRRMQEVFQWLQHL